MLPLRKGSICSSPGTRRLNPTSVARRATEPYHIHVFLVLLYGAMPPSASPVTSAIPPKTDRNKEIYQRYLVGESPTVLAREYGISEQRVFVIIRNQKKRSQFLAPFSRGVSSALFHMGVPFIHGGFNLISALSIGG